MKLVSVTTRNVARFLGDAELIDKGAGHFQENLIEFAGRVCYRSVERMGTSPNFIQDKVQRGHEDIIEHIVVTIEAYIAGDWSDLRVANRHCEITQLRYSWLITGNLRVWLDFFRKELLLDALPILTAIAPSVFAEFGAQPVTLDYVRQAFSVPCADHGVQRITLLGANLPNVSDDHLLHHGSATFLIEGISRACTHQLVRHRLASFSQESQRYVDLSKGEWSAIIPPEIYANDEAYKIMEDFFYRAEEAYRQLRELGIRKEDARFLLPNATETRIVTTMNFAAWSHFCWLRAVDKAAQWEIRQMGQDVLEQLHWIAPGVFQEHMEAMRK
jgi:thymidylate synthase (FAD)